MTWKALHDQEIQRLAADFRRRGYEVLVEPKDSDVPVFLRGFSPDLLALRADDNLVIEVSGSGRLELDRVVERVDREPGWSFVLVVPPAADEPAREIALEDESAIRERLDVPAQLLAEGQAVAAVLLAWSLFEAAARRRMALDGSDPLRAAGSEALVKRLVHLGYLPQNAVAELGDVARTRNRAAHGDLRVPLSPDALARLREATVELLRSPQAA